MATPAAQSALARTPAYAKAALALGIVALTAGAYWFVFYSDTAAKIEGAERQKKALRDELTQEQQAQASYFADRDELAVREQRARELNKLLPPEAQEDAFLSSVQQASNAAGIDLKAYAPQEEVGQNFYAKVPMRLEMSGKFHQIAKFAYELGKVDRIINVEDIELTDPKVIGDEVVLKGRCLATAFHATKPKPPRAARASPGAAAPPVVAAPTHAQPPPGSP
ncbi:MAG TPA: type 4a pilus biogenesis protein PilO [Polyangiaceae bacterium]|nr:type 4a pilus biogenesis protein PilO [Polyangiaceae bacterium]